MSLNFLGGKLMDENKEIEIKAKKKKSIISKRAGEKIIEDLARNCIDSLISSGFTALDQVVDAVKDSIKMSVLGKENAKNHTVSPVSSRTNYGRYWVSKNENREKLNRDIFSRNIYEYETLEFESRSMADYCLNKLKYYISTRGYVTVGQYYQIARLPYSNVDMRWGWNNLNSVIVQQNLNRKWILIMPEAMEIEEER